MYSEFMPGCCSAKIIVDFGGGHVGQTENFTKQEVIRWVKKQLSLLKRDRKAVVLAIPTSTQPNAIAALEELGFYSHPNPEVCAITPKGRHKILPMFIALNEWDEEAFDKRYDPTLDTYENKKNNGYDQIDIDKKSARRRW